MSPPPSSSSFLLLPLLLFILPLSSSSVHSYSELGDPSVHEFIPLARRAKRQTAPVVSGVRLDDLMDMNGGTFPPDYDIEDENKETGSSETTTEHTYYNMTTITNNATVFDSVYVDIEKWISEGGADGQTEHDHLNEAYRKAAGIRLKFEFPFYGHRLANLTMATGGFLYVGDQTHSWLAATQYIAPLMANFDTIANGSAIQHADDGKRMIVEWREVTLRDNRAAGPFTFQVHLWHNGNITFVYKQVPIPVANISDAQHPCKLGISDAYLFNHRMSGVPQSMPQNKRVIHEYHRITIPPEKISSGTVVMLKALPTCLDATNCEQCIQMQLKAFKCSWCNPKDSGKGQSKDNGGGAEGGAGDKTAPERPFCSDQLGLHRRRQEWIEGNCQLQEENQYCKAEEAPEGGNGTSGGSPAPTAPGELSTAIPRPSAAIPDEELTPAKGTPKLQEGSQSTQTSASVGGRKSPGEGEKGGGGGMAFVTLFTLLGVSLSVWLLYAYFNPHTRSGQLLIKYRPSKWQIPSSHVRYSASVHM